MNTLLSYVPSKEHTLVGHPENAERMVVVMELLEPSGLLDDVLPVEPRLATEEQLLRVHDRSMVDRVRRASTSGSQRLDPDTYVTPASYGSARLAVGGTCAAVDMILSGEATNGLALVRPPGHHADRLRVGGFCLFNNIAVAARQAQVIHGIDRVMIIDFDVHHGNGTQAIFYDDPSVFFISLHLYHRFFYPGTGSLTETGSGAGRGATLNVPLPPGAGDNCYRRTFEEVIEPVSAAFGPELILVSAGFDAHWADPLAAASLSLAGYAWMIRELIGMAEHLCRGRILFVLEGGYQRHVLAYGVLNLLGSLLGSDEFLDPLGPSLDPEPDISYLVKQLQTMDLPK